MRRLQACWLLRCSLMLLRQRYQAGCRSLRHWLLVNQRHGSLVRACTGDSVVLAERHYPEDDWRDLLSGGQAYYHCHRPGDEHGHLHLFMPAEPGAELTHLLGIGLDPRGLPLSLFTLNRWVANDAWLAAEPTFALVQRFSLAASDADRHASAWLDQFLRFYRPMIWHLLLDRDRVLADSGCSLEQALENRDLEIPSQLPIDWGADLDDVQQQWRSHGEKLRSGTVASPSRDGAVCADLRDR
ncbi:hypothetical protein VB738_02055 [Cyanobium gracile UHCC 0139]|uniref:DUF6969 domain-containing protein n=1 Tax=Cyanobium gracile UHCC 0139 TaxID=3110308 RepID=A0ABU5RQK7_9CYAN|nr:hypothetical protein [Cyanobium gracile]MEA5390036.1 hypothetical protein [Cyanobium gracile UHCC 0139]